MKITKFLLSILILLLPLTGFCAAFNSVSGLIEIPTADTLDHLEFELGVSQAMGMSSDQEDYLGPDWVEEDAKAGLGLKLLGVNMELGFTMYSWLYDEGGDYGVAHIKVRLLNDPMDIFINPSHPRKFVGRERLLPAIALGVKNIGGDGLKYVNEVGLEGDSPTNNSFYLVMSKTTFNSSRTKFKVHFGAGANDFMGTGRNKSPGIFFGSELRLKQNSNMPIRILFDYSGKHWNIGADWTNYFIKMSVAITRLENLRKKDQDEGLNPLLNFSISFTNHTIRNSLAYDKFLGKEPSAVATHIPTPTPTPTPTPQPKDILTKLLDKDFAAERTSSGFTILIDDLTFNKNGTITNFTKRKLARLIEIFNIDSSMGIIVEGHTDSIGNLNEKLQYSETQANSVKSYFLKKVENPSRIISIGLGNAKPLVDKYSSDAYRINNRIEIDIVKSEYWSYEISNHNELRKTFIASIKAPSPIATHVPTPTPVPVPVPTPIPVEPEPEPTPVPIPVPVPVEPEPEPTPVPVPVPVPVEPEPEPTPVPVPVPVPVEPE
ncbi:OmpA family protein, partial [Candidatus Dependentiae bacterium]|nr:OmpA family protein [Candidatus Dependentiae bacterium]